MIKLTLNIARETLRPSGIVISRTEHGEYRVNFVHGKEASAYYTTDLKDAIGTGRAMATKKNPRAHPGQDYTGDEEDEFGWGHGEMDARRTRKNGKVSACPYCGGPLEYHGSLGYMRHFRCRNCGQWSSKMARKRKPKKNPYRRSGRSLSVADRHQLKIARDTLKMHDAAVHFMGGPNKTEAREIIFRLTGKREKSNPRYRKSKKRRYGKRGR